MEGDNMANLEHLAILKKGVEAWNEWRRQNPGVGADLMDANLNRVNLNGANLITANLIRADLSGANLSGADLIEAHLSGAHLIRADLTAADLRAADLTAADLRGANLQQANLRYGHLLECNLTGAKLTGVKLYGTPRDDWIIKDVDCSYVFWDAEGKIRSPKDRDLAPGEFEHLYGSLPTIEYIFQNGMTPLDPLIMDRVVQAIRRQNPEYDIRIDSISARGLAPSIKFTVQQAEQKEPALQTVIAEYEGRVRRLEGEKDRLYGLLGMAIDKAGTRLLVVGPGAVVATDGSTINIDQQVECITNLRDTVAALPDDDPTFAKVTKKTALDLIGSALKDVAKGQVKEAAKQICELGKDLGPVIVNTVAYGFFKSYLGL